MTLSRFTSRGFFNDFRIFERIPDSPMIRRVAAHFERPALLKQVQKYSPSSDFLVSATDASSVELCSFFSSAGFSVSSALFASSVVSVFSVPPAPSPPSFASSSSRAC